MPFTPSEMFCTDRIIDLQGTTKPTVLKELVDVLATSDKVTDADQLLEKILEREGTLSTGVGVGLAIPHVKIPSVRDFVIGVGRHQKGVEFQSIDNLPVHIIVMIGCHESQSADYMKVLSRLVRSLKERDFRDRVMNAKTKREVYECFVGGDGVFPA